VAAAKMDLKDKTILVRDYGLFASWASKLTAYFGRVLYYAPFKSAFPRSQQYAIGTGLEGVERVTDFWDHVDEVDIFFFPDVYDGDLQETLREMGKPVWGSAKGEELELMRWQTKLFLKKDLHLPVQPVERIIGLSELREYLGEPENENKYVKISLLRGDVETFHHQNFLLSEPILDDIEQKLGPYKESKEFIVEDAIDQAIEIGYDGFTIDGQYPDPGMFGYEIKDVAYVGVVRPYEELPEPVKEVNAKLAPVFADYNYRGFWSSEIRLQKDGKPYLTDPCCRAGSPPSELYQEMFSNWGDIIWFGAHGELVAPQPTGKFGVEILIHSAWADQHWQAVYAEPEIRQWVKLRNLCQVDDTLYVAPQVVGLPEIGAIVAVDDSLLGAIKKLKQYCQKINGYSLSLNLERVAEAIDTIKTGVENGIPFSDETLPTQAQVAKVLGS
jgi:hypothetical protein